MVWTVRVDVSPIRDFFKMFSCVLVALVITIIVAFTGPPMLLQDEISTWNCTDFNHTYWKPQNCSGVQMNGGGWSPPYSIQTEPLNRHWYCQIYPFSLPDAGSFETDVMIDVLVIGTADGKNTVLTNSTTPSRLICPENGTQCVPFLLYQVTFIEYPQYSIAIQIRNKTGIPVAQLADVVLLLSKDNDKFSVMALVLHLLFLGTTIAVLGYHIVLLREPKLDWNSWAVEQKLLIALVIALMLNNNPFYPLEYLLGGWGVIFFSDFLELIFTMVLFITWFILLSKLHSKESEVQWDGIYLKIQLGLIMLYGVLTTILYGWASIRDESSPLFGISDHIDGIQVFFFLSSALYVAIAVSFCISLVLTLAITKENREDKKVRFYFFALPTLVAILCILTGLFSGTLGPFGRDSTSFVFFISLYNVYTYVLIWGFWPVEVGLQHAQNPTEGSPIFPAPSVDFVPGASTNNVEVI